MESNQTETSNTSPPTEAPREGQSGPTGSSGEIIKEHYTESEFEKNPWQQIFVWMKTMQGQVIILFVLSLLGILGSGPNENILFLFFYVWYVAALYGVLIIIWMLFHKRFKQALLLLLLYVLVGSGTCITNLFFGLFFA